MITMKPGDLILFDASEHREVLSLLDGEGYRFYHGDSLLTSVFDKYGIRWDPKYSFPECLSTLDLSMANRIRKGLSLQYGDKVKWNVIEYKNIVLEMREVGDLL